ncbi:MAG TPA: preprotein translocase subunit YajC [Gaiellaceae bacterium]|nr:preprotein translocase subunit YajC [Gaiellaceae bacterium]
MNPSALILLVVAFGFLYFVLVRPQKRRQMSQQQMLQGLKEGDEVVTAAGIYGEVTGFQEDDVLVRIAPEVEVRVARKAIGAIVARPDETEGVTADEPVTAPEPQTAEEREDLQDPHGPGRTDS